MVIVQVVVYLRGMEFSWVAYRLSSERTAVLARHTTLIVAEMVYIVLCSVFLQLAKSVFSV